MTVIDINKASVEQLQDLKNIGEKRARQIVQKRLDKQQPLEPIDPLNIKDLNKPIQKLIEERVVVFGAEVDLFPMVGRPTPPAGSQVDSDLFRYIRDQMTEMGGQIRAELNVQLKSAFTEVSSKLEQVMGSLDSRFNELDARMLKMESGTNPKTDRPDDMSSYKANNHGHGEGARPKPSQGAGNNGEDKVAFPVSMLAGAKDR